MNKVFAFVFWMGIGGGVAIIGVGVGDWVGRQMPVDKPGCACDPCKCKGCEKAGPKAEPKREEIPRLTPPSSVPKEVVVLVNQFATVTLDGKPATWAQIKATDLGRLSFRMGALGALTIEAETWPLKK